MMQRIVLFTGVWKKFDIIAQHVAKTEQVKQVMKLGFANLGKKSC